MAELISWHSGENITLNVLQLLPEWEQQVQKFGRALRKYVNIAGSRMRQEVRYTFCWCPSALTVRSFACVGAWGGVYVCVSHVQQVHGALWTYYRSLSLAGLGKYDLISVCEKALDFSLDGQCWGPGF